MNFGFHQVYPYRCPIPNHIEEIHVKDLSRISAVPAIFRSESVFLFSVMLGTRHFICSIDQLKSVDYDRDHPDRKSEFRMVMDYRRSAISGRTPGSVGEASESEPAIKAVAANH